MALGGGTYLTQNKVLPGTYINFISAARASASLADRGIAALAISADWGPEGKIFEVESGDFQKKSMEIFGYPYTDDKMKRFRDLFKNCKTALLYRLNTGTKATNQYAEALYSGTRGNDISIAVAKKGASYEVTTLFQGTAVDKQTVASSAELCANSYVTFYTDVPLAVTSIAGEPLLGGTAETNTGSMAHQLFLEKLENYSFHVLGCTSQEEEIKELYIQYTKRMREEVGAKFQTVIYHYEEAVDYEGVVHFVNPVIGGEENSLVYWLSGALAGCEINKTLTNRVYDGEYDVDAEYTQAVLEAHLKAGHFVFHRMGREVRVLEDINSFTGVTVQKNEDFSLNQVIRVLDQIGNDIAVLFQERYLGKVQNNNAGRVAFWNDIVTYNRKLQTLEAIVDFEAEHVKVTQGEDKRSVIVENAVTPACAMTRLYMTVVVN